MSDDGQISTPESHASLQGEGGACRRQGRSDRCTAGDSRLTHSLVEAGFPSYNMSAKAYQLEAVFLRLAQVFQSHSFKLKRAYPLMDTAARRDRINVGLAARDKDEMVYLDSIRFSRAAASRKIPPGTRVPIAPTALGRAYKRR